ncbi:hypothetical protein N7457_001590 [Penicillium paradoxum]|uniref:uncharacterized protein n=1 Tax=Penicillium paradoxum TaxID=176176 RepID=UPI00254975E5|nr:uncharacterized protein N7457_001590 [Penicillium paradoxum]KAJ5794991.1 hypothetical protein N7457_001590 [Penicillium paradoxum]
MTPTFPLSSLAPFPTFISLAFFSFSFLSFTLCGLSCDGFNAVQSLLRQEQLPYTAVAISNRTSIW